MSSQGLRLLTNLARIWSRERETMIETVFQESHYSADVQEKIIYISESVNSENITFPEWRIHRFGCFHESKHIELTPSNYLLTLGRRDIDKGIFNVVEDTRIENIGLEEYPGYKKEREFTICCVEERTKKKPVDFSKFPRSLQIAGQLIKMTLGAKLHTINSTLSAKEERKIKKFSNILRHHSPKTPQESFDLSEKISRSFKLHFHESKKFSVLVIIADGEGKENIGEKEWKKIFKKAGKKAKANKILVEEFNKLQKDIKKSVKQMEKERGAITSKDIDIPSLNVTVPNSDITVYSKLMSQHQPKITLLKSMLRRWRIGWAETSDKVGDDIDTDSFILGDENFYFNEKKLAYRTKLFILQDMSGSTLTYEDYYKAMSGIIAETLSYLGINFELAVFGMCNELHQIKTLDYQWNDTSRGRLGVQHSYGGTPMGHALEYAYHRCKRESIPRIVMLSDGIPSDLTYTKKICNLLEKSGIKLYCIAFTQCNKSLCETRNIYKIPKELILTNYNAISAYRGIKRVRIISDLTKLPITFFNLIKSEES